PRGLSVLSRVMRIFTHSIISPGLSLRQCSSRCIFRAGRNLPDKEFRYLRTVIVTAAVYWGFDAVLRTEVLTHSLNLPAPGRCHPLYFALRLRRDLCFCLTVAWACLLRLTLRVRTPSPEVTGLFFRFP